MQLLDNLEVTSLQSKHPFNAIYDLLNATVNNIQSTNEELKMIRDRANILESKNETLMSQVHEMIAIIARSECRDSSVQSDQVHVIDVGIDCQPAVTVKDASEGTINIVEHVIEVAEPEVPAVVPEPIEEPPAPKAVAQEPRYSKEDMLFYLERYKISFLSFVQCNKEDIGHAASGCADLIRSLSGGEPKSRRRTEGRRRAEERPGVLETVVADEGLRCSLYGDLDYQDVLAGKRPPESATVVVATEESKPKMSLLRTGPTTKVVVDARGVQRVRQEAPPPMPVIRIDLAAADDVRSLPRKAAPPPAKDGPSPPKMSKVAVDPQERPRHRHEDPKKRHGAHKKRQKDLEEGEIV